MSKPASEKTISALVARAQNVGIDAWPIRNVNPARRKPGALGSTFSPSRVIMLDGAGYSLGGARQYIAAREQRSAQ